MRQTGLTRIERARRALLLALPLIAGCLSQHEGPGASDTATNWLKSCSSDAVCGGGSCIDQVCTVSCSPKSAAVCTALAEGARCETKPSVAPVCDLPCSSQVTCAEFRAGYTCQEGYCRGPQPPQPPGSEAGAEASAEPSEPSTSNDSGAVTPPSSDAGAESSGNGTGTLISIIAADSSGYISTPHTIEVLGSSSGLPLDPPVQVVSASDGTFSLPSQSSSPPTLHVLGQGNANDANATFDALKLNFDPNKDPLLRIMSVGTATIGATTGGYTPRQDRAELLVTVYYTNASGKRLGYVGCAKAFLDGDGAAEADLRYVGPSRLPATLAQQSSTLRSSGRFQFGNLSKGSHLLSISVDDGKTFVAQLPFYMPLTRGEASSPYKAVHAELDIDVIGDPTPGACAQ